MKTLLTLNYVRRTQYREGMKGGGMGTVQGVLDFMNGMGVLLEIGRTHGNDMMIWECHDDMGY